MYSPTAGTLNQKYTFCLFSLTKSSLSIQDAVAVLLKHSADVNARDKNWQTPLHVAASNKAVRCAEALVPLLSNVNVSDRAGRTALHHAAFSGHVEVGPFANIHMDTGIELYPFNLHLCVRWWSCCCQEVQTLMHLTRRTGEPFTGQHTWVRMQSGYNNGDMLYWSLWATTGFWFLGQTWRIWSETTDPKCSWTGPLQKLHLQQWLHDVCFNALDRQNWV